MSKSEAVKWIALGLLVGYLGLYAWNLIENWKEKASQKPEKPAQRNYV